MKKLLFAALLASFAAAAPADVNVGVILSTTGPAAPLGIPERNTVDLLPRSIAGQKVNYIVLDDASEPAQAVPGARRLLREDKVDAIIGPTTTASSLALVDAAAAGETPMIAVAASAVIVEPMDEKRLWVFKTPQNDAQMVTAIVEHMTDRKVRTVAYIGFADAYGESWWNEFARIAAARKLQVVANERFNRTDPSVAEQIGKILAARPDAVLIGGAGLPALLPQKSLREKGYPGLIYQTRAVANADFLRACGGDCAGAFVPAGPVLVAEQLPADHPAKKAALEYIRKYEAAYGPGSVSAFGAHVWDAGLLLAAAIPAALAKAEPGSREFRLALREALENVRNLPAAHGVFNMSANDHLGFDQRARVMVRVERGAWRIAR